MSRGNTDLSNYEYDSFLAKNKKEKELRQRNDERKSAHKKDMSGWHFGIDTKPVKTKDISEFRQELSKRGLAIDGDKNVSKEWKSKLKYK